ncbi:IS21 family transposase [Glutamicibacter sp. ZJUTW]|uniref:IS21 family transposase n=1 Tax=Glutamicibacter sp. ZJUTW TaxID=1155384 RepID=UPI00143DC3B5|nr:IS21 family transposase [Glutamicibacter sp. ZJUTW]
MNTLRIRSVITLEDSALIRRLVKDGVPKSRIACDLGISRTTVVKAAASTTPPKYERKQQATAFAPYEDAVRCLLKETPTIPSTVIAERIGWTGSVRWLREHVAKIRPEMRPADPADRITWLPGDAAQCDLWFPPQKIPLGQDPASLMPVLVMTLAHSRFMAARMIPSRHTEDLLLGMWDLLQQFERVPRRLIWDNETGIGRGGKRAVGVEQFMGSLGTKLVLLPPRDPESKGIVERRNDFYERSFMPGRQFESPQDFNEQLSTWIRQAKTRTVRTIRRSPMELLDTDREAMRPLPPAVFDLGWHHQVRLPRDYYVRVATCDYSVAAE